MKGRSCDSNDCFCLLKFVCCQEGLLFFFARKKIKIKITPSKHSMAFSLEVNWTCGPICYIHRCANARKSVPMALLVTCLNMDTSEKLPHGSIKTFYLVFFKFQVSITSFPLPNPNLLSVHSVLWPPAHNGSLLLCVQKRICEVSSDPKLLFPTLRQRDVQMQRVASVQRCNTLSNILVLKKRRHQHEHKMLPLPPHSPPPTTSSPTTLFCLDPLQLMKEHTVCWPARLDRVVNKNITCFHLGYLHSSFTHTKGSGIPTAYWSGAFSSSGSKLQKHGGPSLLVSTNRRPLWIIRQRKWRNTSWKTLTVQMRIFFFFFTSQNMQDVLLLINDVYSALTIKTALWDSGPAELGLAVMFLERSFHFFHIFWQEGVLCLQKCCLHDDLRGR